MPGSSTVRVAERNKVKFLTQRVGSQPELVCHVSSAPATPFPSVAEDVAERGRQALPPRGNQEEEIHPSCPGGPALLLVFKSPGLFTADVKTAQHSLTM